MINDSYFSVSGYIATQPVSGMTAGGVPTLSMRVGWTPRRYDRVLAEWTDEPSSFVSVRCYRKLADNGAACLRKGDPIVLKGTLRVREFTDAAGAKRNAVDVVADFIGHDMTRGISSFNKTLARQAQTALEALRAGRAEAGGGPLPGDRDDAAASGPVDGQDDQLATGSGPGGRELSGPAADGLEDPDDEEAFDDDEAAELLADGSEPAVLSG
ncbi:MAG TPA: single-stranded DNA-binding protein [Streptosporangiaceae bacterium]